MGPGHDEGTFSGRNASRPSSGMTVRRAVVVFACVSVGFLAARALPVLPAALWFSLACLGCAFAAALRGVSCKVALSLAAVVFSGGWWTSRVAERADGPLWALMDSHEAVKGAGDGAGDLVLSLEGIALDEPRAAPAAGAMSAFAQREPYGGFRFLVTALKTEGGWVDASGVVWARARGTTWDARRGLGGFGVHAGDRVRVTATAEPTRAPMNPGEPDQRLRAIQDGNAGSIRIDSPALIEPAAGAGSTAVAARSWFLGTAARVRAASERLLDPGPLPSNEPVAAAQADRSRALLGSLFLGVREAGEPEIRGQFTRLGLAHVLAISGFHVTVAVGVALLLVRLTGDRGRLEPLVLAALVGVYLVLVPADAPVVRAAVMVLVLLVSRGMGRRYDDLNTLAWTGVGLLLWSPMDLWSLGFQLSLGLTALLLWQGRAFHERLFGAPILGLARPSVPTSVVLSVVHAMQQWTARALSAGLMCWLASMPLIAVTTGMFSPLSALTGLIVLPLVVVLMWCGYGLLVAGLIAGAFGIDLVAWTTGVLGPMASVVVRVIAWLDSVPGTSFMWPPMSAWWGLAATAGVMVWIVRGAGRDRLTWISTALVAVWGIGEFVWPGVGAARRRAELCELSLGSGACTIIESAGETVLWNCGGNPSSAGRTIARAARDLGVFHARVVVLAGDDLASMAALPDVVATLGVREVWLGPAFDALATSEPEGAAGWLRKWLVEQGVPTRVIRDGDVLRVGAASIQLRVCGVDARPSGRSARTPAAALLGLVSVRSSASDRANPGPRAVLGSELRDRHAEALGSLGAALRAEVVEMPRLSGSRTVGDALLARTEATLAFSAARESAQGQRDEAGSTIVISSRARGAVRIVLDSSAGVRVTAARRVSEREE